MAKRMSMAERLKQSGSATVRRLDEAQQKLKGPLSGKSTEQSGCIEGDKKDDKSIRIISGSYQDQDNITKGADTEQISIMSLSPKEQDKVSPKEQDFLSQKSITKGAGQISLSKCQSNIYLWLCDRGLTGEFNKPEIQKSLSMPYITVRKSVLKLETLGILKLTYDKCQKFYSYSVNKKIPVKLSKRSSIISISYQDQNSITSPSLNSSSSSLNKKLTNSPNKNEIEKTLNTHPELNYWRQKKLTVKQICAWTNEFQLTTDSIIESLCVCADDMIRFDEKDAKGIKIKNVFDWFYSRIQKTGFYHSRDDNYKSWEQRQLEQAKQRLEEKQKIAAELKRIREKEQEEERNILFEKMLKDPKSKVYSACFEQLNDFTKRRKHNSDVFITGMRTAFNRYMDEYGGETA